jgi:hypothetical protein
MSSIAISSAAGTKAHAISSRGLRAAQLALKSSRFGHLPVGVRRFADHHRRCNETSIQKSSWESYQ